jgi:hypothetical protein
MAKIAISDLPLFTGGTSGTYVLINNSGQTETFKATREQFIGGGNLLPTEDNTFTLGDETYRWKSISIGPGTIFITDTVLGTEAGLTVTNGVLLINGANQLQVGSLKFVNNDIQSISTSTDIKIALTADTANLVLNRNTVIASGKTLTFGDDTTQNTAYITPVSNSFNPLFTDVSGTTSGITFEGSYTMIAPKICYLRVDVNFSGCTNFGNSQYKITLPFPSKSTMRQAGGTLHQTSGASLYHIAGITDIMENDSTLKLYYFATTSDLAWKYNTPVAATTTTSHFDISLIYEIV